MDTSVLQAIDRQKALPSAPEVVTRLMELTKNPEYRTDQVAKLIASDAGLSADILRLANSALLGGGRKLASVSEALVRLGMGQVRGLVLSRGMIQSFEKSRVPQLDMSYFWRRSLATAALSARFAEAMVNVPRDLAFTSGLLCDVGVLVLAQALNAHYGRILEQYGPQRGDEMVVSEIELIGGSHADISAMALEKWSLPEEVVQAVRYHHHADLPELPQRVTQVARIVNGSGEIARFLCEARSKTVVRSMCLWAIDVIGVRPKVFQTVIQQVEADIGELAAALRIEIVSSKVYELLAQAIAEQLEPTAA